MFTLIETNFCPIIINYYYYVWEDYTVVELNFSRSFQSKIISQSKQYKLYRLCKLISFIYLFLTYIFSNIRTG